MRAPRSWGFGVGSTLRVLAVVISAFLAGCAIVPIAHDRSGTAPVASPVTATVLDASHGWELTSGGIWRTVNGGRTWVRIKNLPSINYAWGTVASFPSPDNAWVCQQGRARGSKPGSIGDTRTSSSPPGECFATSDGGRTWTTYNVPHSGTTSVGRGRDDATINDLTAADGRNAWIIVGTIATFAGGGQESINLIEVRLLHTLDAGAHWTSIRDVEAPRRRASPRLERSGSASTRRVGSMRAVSTTASTEAATSDGRGKGWLFPSPRPVSPAPPSTAPSMRTVRCCW